MEHLDHRPLTVTLPTTTLRGRLALPYVVRGLIVIVTPRSWGAACAVAGGESGDSGGGAGAEAADSDEALARALHAAGFATLGIDLLHGDECRFADASRHLPLLGERLLAVVSALRLQIALDAIPAIPIGLFADGDATPLAIRVAAQRDQDVAALACHGGLVDLAGLQYLKVLQAPLLLLFDAADTIGLTNARRAKPYLAGPCEIRELAATANTDVTIPQMAVDWFAQQFPSPAAKAHPRPDAG